MLKVDSIRLRDLSLFFLDLVRKFLAYLNPLNILQRPINWGFSPPPPLRMSPLCRDWVSWSLYFIRLFKVNLPELPKSLLLTLPLMFLEMGFTDSELNVFFVFSKKNFPLFSSQVLDFRSNYPHNFINHHFQSREFDFFNDLTAYWFSSSLFLEKTFVTSRVSSRLSRWPPTSQVWG